MQHYQMKYFPYTLTSATEVYFIHLNHFAPVASKSLRNRRHVAGSTFRPFKKMMQRMLTHDIAVTKGHARFHLNNV
jgi:hypothetical protein